MTVGIDTVGIALGASALVVGQTIDAVTDVQGVGTLVQGGAFLVLSYAFLHVLIKTLPQRDKEFRDALTEAAQRRIDAERLTREDSALTRQSIEHLATAVAALQLHCAKVQVREDR
jgi:membrane protein implicated in regulation of membrane protease activity